MMFIQVEHMMDWFISLIQFFFLIKAKNFVNVIGNQWDQLIFQLNMEYIYMREIGLFEGLLFQSFIYVNNEYIF